MFARHSVKPSRPSRPVSSVPAGRDQGAPCQDAETSNNEQSGVLGGSLPGYKRDREERIRRDHLRRRGQCPQRRAVSSTASGDGQPLREKTLLPGYQQALQEFLQHTLVASNALVADTEVDEAPVAFFNEKYRLGCSTSKGDILLGAVCHYFSGAWGTWRALLATQPSCPAPPPEAEILTRVWATRTLEFLRHGHWSMGIYVLWMVTCCFRPRDPLTTLRRDI